MLHAKRDLYLLAFDGVVQLLKRSEAPDAGAILEAVKDIFSDICDDWRDLTHGARRDAADAASRVLRPRPRAGAKRPFIEPRDSICKASGMLGS